MRYLALAVCLIAAAVVFLSSTQDFAQAPSLDSPAPLSSQTTN
ncbi:MAG: hypothetical protein PWQ57_3017 [Desulfovibrionales bacterium]|nr:hypothetical protein [Desulfovibrionales bacterium]